MKKKITALLLAAVMMVAAFMGCGKAEDKAEEPKETGKAPIDAVSYTHLLLYRNVGHARNKSFQFRCNKM